MLNFTDNDCADIFIMEIKKKYQRMDIETKLNNTYKEMAKEKRYTYLQVKIVQTGHYKKYDITNSFYVSAVHKKLKCFRILWDKRDSCQIYTRYIGN
nr:hypothetical protein [Leptotrichia sp. OH3620_COT-345]